MNEVLAICCSLSLQDPYFLLTFQPYQENYLKRQKKYPVLGPCASHGFFNLKKQKNKGCAESSLLPYHLQLMPTGGCPSCHTLYALCTRSRTRQIFLTHDCEVFLPLAPLCLLWLRHNLYSKILWDITCLQQIPAKVHSVNSKLRMRTHFVLQFY